MLHETSPGRNSNSQAISLAALCRAGCQETSNPAVRTSEAAYWLRPSDARIAGSRGWNRETLDSVVATAYGGEVGPLLPEL